MSGSRWLFAAEADKIQDFIFRATKLKQVVGGSALLSEFCQEGCVKLLTQIDPTAEVIINNGGNFRIMFKEKEKAEKFGEMLAELYSRITGSTITVAKVQPCDVNDFQKANDSAQLALRNAKMSNRGFKAVAQNPFMAYCAVCGAEVAEGYDDKEGKYLCRYCQNKMRVREDAAYLSTGKLRAFLEQKLLEYDSGKYRDVVKKLATPNTEEIGKYAQYGFIAYFIADANDMGVYFSESEKPEDMKKRSKELAEAMWSSFAEASWVVTRKLLEDKRKFNDKLKLEVLPTLPLIIGGDDCFAAVSAKYALLFAKVFTEKFKAVMGKEVSSAVVFCKSDYPYSLAHQIGDQLLKEAKTKAKEEKTSAINYIKIEGSYEKWDFASNEKYVLTKKPFTIAELQELFKLAEVFRTIPKNKWQAMRDLINDTTSEKEKWVRDMKSIDKNIVSKQYKEWLRKDENNNDDRFKSFWELTASGKYVSRIADVIELDEFLYGIALEGEEENDENTL